MAADADDALRALFLPFETGALQWPSDGGALFLRAREGWPLRASSRPGLDFTQGFKPAAEALQRSGLTLVEEDVASERRYRLVLLLPPRQREESRALFARAIALLRPGGIVVASMPNDEGAKAGEADLARLAGPLGVLSKHHCRVFWSQPLDRAADPDLRSAWAALDAPREIVDARFPGGRFTSRPGVFAWDRIDAASALLAAHLPTDLAGDGADLGAGLGYLSAHVLTHCPRIAALDLFEADARALALARTNLAHLAPQARLGFHWHDVTAGLPKQYDFLVSNPPFHALGRNERPDIGRAFIAAAAAALQPGGRFWLVANRHLPYEAVLDASFGQVRTVAQQGGFKVVEAVKTAADAPAARRRAR
jgi:16S rRNA (guanine1207-N2)-methyltransferase